MAISVREAPPLRLARSITTPSGKPYRWAEDAAKAQNVPQGTRFSSTIPGGFETYEDTLPRKTEIDYGDLDRLSTIKVTGAGGEPAWEGRLERAPRQSGSELAVSPNAVGWQAHLSDDNTPAEVYRDIDMSHWQGMGPSRKIATSATRRITDAEVAADPSTGAPALNTHFDSPWNATPTPRSEGWYDAGANVAAIGNLYYAWKRGTNVDNADTNWSWLARLTTDDLGTTTDTTAELRAAGPGSGTLSATASNRRFAFVLLANTAAQTTSTNYDLFWTTLAVHGNHGLTKRGTEPAAGFYASDIIANAISRWAPLLSFTTGSNGSIKPSAFVIPHLEFREPTTVAEMIDQANRFHLNDWAVWENKTFYYAPRGNNGRSWRARVAPAQLQETGPQVDRLWNGVIVKYADVDGTARTVGPTGTNATATSADLIDTDTDNPANELGIHRYAVLDMGHVSTVAAATEVGRLFLYWSKQLDSSGQAQLVGTVEDDKGITRPAWQVRAGDTISFVDASDTGERRIVRSEYEHDSRTNTIDLDAPPEGMSALLERLGVVLVSLGLS